MSFILKIVETNNCGPSDGLIFSDRLDSVYITDKLGQTIHCKLNKFRKIAVSPKHIKDLVENINSK